MKSHLVFYFESTSFRLAHYIRLKLPFGISPNVNTSFCFVCHRLLAWPFPVLLQSLSLHLSLTLMLRVFFLSFHNKQGQSTTIYGTLWVCLFFTDPRYIKKNKIKSKQVHPSWLKWYRLVPRCLPLKLNLRKSFTVPRIRFETTFWLWR